MQIRGEAFAIEYYLTLHFSYYFLAVGLKLVVCVFCMPQIGLQCKVILSNPNVINAPMMAINCILFFSL